MTSLSVEEDPFWFDDISILYNKDRLIEFVPTTDMNAVDRLNSIARIALYTGILTSIMYQNASFLYIAVIGLGLTYFLHKQTHLGDENYEDENYEDEEETQEGGNPPGKNGNAVNGNAVDGNGMVYQKPNKENPFANVLLTDYVDNPNRPPAGNVEDPIVKAGVEKHFANGLYKNANDIWDKNNSQRQYLSTPGTTIPNDRHSFMQWCWNIPYSCKDGDLIACMDRDEVRHHGQI